MTTIKNSELKFLVSTLQSQGLSEEDFTDLIVGYEKITDLKKKLNKSMNSDNSSSPLLLEALLSKYVEVRKRLESMIDVSPELLLKRKSELDDQIEKFNKAVSSHPLGEEKVKEVFPIFSKV